MRQEIRWWLTHRSADILLIGWTDGTLVWDAERAAFDWALTDGAILAQIRRGSAAGGDRGRSDALRRQAGVSGAGAEPDDGDRTTEAGRQTPVGSRRSAEA
ncbi:hypothetical protein ACFV5E_08680 [Streptomyces chartreusis]|uniref:hypothetical protein n=1 Tax=Streptomyces chartreusis TaxID=1969 RepID=UPI0036896364